MKIESKNLGTIIGGGALLVAAAATWLMLLPSLRAISETQSSIGQLQGEVAQKQQELENLRLLAKQGFSQQLALVGLASPVKPAVPELLVMADTIAKKSGLTLVNAAPSASSGGTRVELSMSGGFGGLVSFLDNLNRNIRPATVKGFSATAQAGSAGQGATSTVTVSAEFVGGAAAKKQSTTTTPSDDESKKGAKQ